MEKGKPYGVWNGRGISIERKIYGAVSARSSVSAKILRLSDNSTSSRTKRLTAQPRWVWQVRTL